MFLSLNIADVLSEEAILKWYKVAHGAKGKSVFLEQMKKFVEWLQSAEEGNNNITYYYLFHVLYTCQGCLLVLQPNMDIHG